MTSGKSTICDWHFYFLFLFCIWEFTLLFVPCSQTNKNGSLLGSPSYYSYTLTKEQILHVLRLHGLPNYFKATRLKTVYVRLLKFLLRSLQILRKQRLSAHTSKTHRDSDLQIVVGSQIEDKYAHHRKHRFYSVSHFVWEVGRLLKNWIYFALNLKK